MNSYGYDKDSCLRQAVNFEENTGQDLTSLRQKDQSSIVYWNSDRNLKLDSSKLRERRSMMNQHDQQSEKFLKFTPTRNCDQEFDQLQISNFNESTQKESQVRKSSVSSLVSSDGSIDLKRRSKNYLEDDSSEQSSIALKNQGASKQQQNLFSSCTCRSEAPKDSTIDEKEVHSFLDGLGLNQINVQVYLQGRKTDLCSSFMSKEFRLKNTSFVLSNKGSPSVLATPGFLQKRQIKKQISIDNISVAGSVNESVNRLRALERRSMIEETKNSTEVTPIQSRTS